MTDSQGTGPDVVKCYTQMKVEQFRYEWKVQHFQRAFRISNKMESPTFSTRNSKIKGSVLVGKQSITRVNGKIEFMSLHLNASCAMVEVDVALTFSLLDREDRESYIKSKNATLTEGSKIGFDDFITSKKILARYFIADDEPRLPTNELTILLDLTFVNEPVHQLDHKQAMPLQIPEAGLTKDLSSLLDEAKLSDVTFSVDGHEFKGHKIILAARSSVFAAMFENDMAESRLNRVDIEDIDKDVFAEFLRFIYSDKTEKLDKMADELLRVAEKYGVDKLKLMCVNALFKNLSVYNAVQILILAELYSLSELKDEVIKFMNAHSKEIFDTAEFMKLAESHPRLMVEIVRTRAD